MTDTTLVGLRRLLLDRYDDFRTRLARRLGSEELAQDAIQEAWLRLARATAVGEVRSPSNYLYSIALNAARDHLRGQNYLSAVEVESLLELSDDAPGPARIVEARSDLALLETAIAELPPRRRDILLAARLDGLSRLEIAKRLRISLRLVEQELHRAQLHCLTRLTSSEK